MLFVDDGDDEKISLQRTLSEVVLQNLLQSSENVEIWGDWHAWRGHGSSAPFPTSLALSISSIWLFLSYIFL